MRKVNRPPSAKNLVISETTAALLMCESHQEAAEKLGITIDSLRYRIEQFPEVRQGILAFKDQAQDILYKNVTKAAKKVVSLIDDDRLGFKASQDVLDRVGVSKKLEDDAPKSTTVNIQLNIGNKSITSK